ncbi:MAG: energy transducer TonB [Paludibacteraceae bacterium]|nr:energy transducer TonB [Paludibacteraceae bacterium]
MDVKKAPKANLENKRMTFVLMGVILALGLFYVAFEWTEQEITVYQVENNMEAMFEQEMIENTFREETPPPPPPPAPDVIEELNIVEDDVETENVDIVSEDDQKTVQEIVKVPIAPIEEDPDLVTVFRVVEKMPEFPGGTVELMKYLNSNVKYPIIAQENGIQGRVIVQFTVRRDGSIDDIEVVRSADPNLDKEAIRVIKSMPNWTPGEQRGKKVNCKFTVPVVFKLQT